MTQMRSNQFFDNPDFPFYAGYYTVSPGEIIAEHSHEFTELAYIADGSGEHSYNAGEFYPVKSGDVFVIEPDIVHAYKVSPAEKLTVCNLLFMPSLLKAELDTLSLVTPFVNFYYVEPFLRNNVRFVSRLRLRTNQQLEIGSLLDKLIAEQNSKPLGYETMIKTGLIQLFISLSRFYQQMEQPGAKLGQDEQTLQTILAFIRKHYAQPLTLEQISHVCGMSASVFSAKFKMYTGKTFIEYRNDIRLGMAEEAIRETSDKIADIALQVGFDDLSFFNKLFKKKTGLTPGQLRKKPV
ncbi:AraC family transcriptional regulator [Bacillus sp. 3255]|uniref:AraC family transcriptional regulator n=1 Tax=Bacillus sp. 3255 TaxID=2817904 RepID=UPI00285D5210|nr:AraC family transcriptional regulator [Bacillus sp. 3255]MDR6884810.1 AraC family L-rhamnose operon regulatory protein RhaS [Bacillus sp. 3255]